MWFGKNKLNYVLVKSTPVSETLNEITKHPNQRTTKPTKTHIYKG